MNRSTEFRRMARHHAICRKKTICLSRDGYDWYDMDGKYSKGKIHCGCGLCKPTKRYKYPSFTTQKELEKYHSELKEYYASVS